jgi:DegV family protein with EDD domain
MLKIITDSDCDMPREFFDKYSVGVVPFGVSYGDENYYTDFYDLKADEFFKRLRETGERPKTSQPAPDAYEEQFRPALSAGSDIICLCITSKFSGSYQSAVTARENLASEFPERSIHIVDTRRCSAVHGYLVYQVCLLLESGASAEEIVKTAEAIKDDHFTFMAVDDLESLKKGGRLGKGAALEGSAISVKSIVAFADGELLPHTNVRGKKNAVAELVRACTKAVGEEKENYIPIAFTCGLPEEISAIADEFLAAGFAPPVHTWGVGTVVGAHLGPSGFCATLVRKYKGQSIF